MRSLFPCQILLRQAIAQIKQPVRGSPTEKAQEMAILGDRAFKKN